MPWRSPGKAPVVDPCGVAGGFHTHGAPGAGGYPPIGVQQGAKGSELPPGPRTVWKAGGTAEVSWSIHSNHGGGYLFRLCPASEALTEECFQRLPLAPAGDVQWLQWGSDKANRTAIRALRTSSGTTPTNSTWTRTPVPACSGVFGGSQHHLEDCAAGPQFPPPVPGLFGFGLGTCESLLPGAECTASEYAYWAGAFNFNVVDKLEVPDVKGDYVLSWRWDSEQTPQVWAGCADLRLE